MVCADLLFVDGTVWTGTGDPPGTDAVAVRDGRILALGPDALRARGAGTEVVSLGGGFLMPGFGDGHAHPIDAALESEGPRVRDLETIALIVESVRAYARAHPEEEWIVGAGYDPALAPDGAFDAAWLDAAVPDRPVVLRAADYHTVWCNTAALARAGIAAATPEPGTGQIVRRPDGLASGTLRESGACDLVLRLVPARRHRMAHAAQVAGNLAAAAGLTWIQDARVDVDSGAVDAYLALAEAATPPVRVSLAWRAEPGRWREQLPAFLAERDRIRRVAPGNLVAADTVKFFADGIVESGTAALLDPYDDAPHSHGVALWEHAELAEAAVAVDRYGFQAHVHAIGDAGVRTALDAIQRVYETNPPRDRRPVMAHTQLVHDDDLPRFAALGVVANFEPLWAQYDPVQAKLTVPRIGTRRGGRQYPIASLHRHGARVSFGSDWPVSTLSPLAGLQVAVTRQTRHGEPPHGWIPEERVDVETALRAYTVGSAYQAFAESDRGTVQPGRQADLVWLSGDPRRVPAHRIASLSVLGTWLAGRRTHDGT